MRIGTLLLAVMVIGQALPVAAEDGDESAVDPRLIGGLYFGAGYAQMSTPDDRGILGTLPSTPDDWSVGATFSGNLGYRTLRQNYVEFVAAGWFGSLEGELADEEWSIGFFGGAYRFYPWDQGAWLRAGFGTGFASVVSNSPTGELKFDDFGLGLLASLGWDSPITTRVHVGPVVDVFYVDVGEDVNSLIVSGSLGVVWR